MDLQVGSRVVWNYNLPDSLEVERRQSVVAAVGPVRCMLNYRGSAYNVLMRNIETELQSDLNLYSVSELNYSMPRSPQFQLRFPEPYLDKIRVWAAAAGVTPSMLIFQAVLEGMPEILKKYGVKDGVVNQMNDKCHLTE